jgi:hypothetical protein
MKYVTAADEGLSFLYKDSLGSIPNTLPIYGACSVMVARNDSFTTFCCHNALVAQETERQTSNLMVGGANPSEGTKKHTDASEREA